MVRMEKMLVTWMDHRRHQGLNVTFDNTKNKAMECYSYLKEKETGPLPDFIAITGWFYQFKVRCGFHSIKCSGEAKSADKEAAASYPDHLKAIIEEEGYKPQQVFNMNEADLQWKMMSEPTYIKREEKSAPGFKAFMDRFTLLLGDNLTGDCRLKPVMVYQAESPRALKGYEKTSLPVHWYTNSTGWMMRHIFQAYSKTTLVHELKVYCTSQGLSFCILMVLDNVPAQLKKKKKKKLNSNKSAGPDGFYPRVNKETEEETAPHFCNIFRISLEQRKAVRDWKLQNISPLFKKGSKDDPGNYRPISLTSVPGKMLESIIADDMMSHLEHNKLILDSQHGFRRGRSCLTNLVDFFHDMFSIYDKSRAVDILYLDFRKAFDKVPHKRLMAKVRSLGIIDEVGDWIEDWLSDRKQRVVINGTSSGWRDVTSGVPQGSVLGPLLFIIYINDLDLGLVSKISKFADDTKVGINADSDAAVKQLQEDLRKVGEWSKKWQMPFNLDKCKIMHIGHKNKNEKYELLGKEIESVQQEKDLGVVITNDLKSSNQCIEAVKKAQKLLGYIKLQFRTRNKETILTI